MLEQLFEMFVAGVEKSLGRKLSKQEHDTAYNIFSIGYEAGYNQRDYELSVKETC